MKRRPRLSRRRNHGFWHHNGKKIIPLVATLALAAAYFGFWLGNYLPIKQNAAPRVLPPKITRPEKKPRLEINSPKQIVRNWLQNNLADPHWEEVQWLVPESIDPRYRTAYLKFRTKNPFGGQSIQIIRFNIRNGAVYLTYDYPYMPGDGKSKAANVYGGLLRDMREGK